MNWRFAICTLWTLLLATVAIAQPIQDKNEYIEKHAHDLGYAMGEYQKTAYYCKELGLFSETEYINYRRIIVTLHSQLLGPKEAFLAVEQAENEFESYFRENPVTVEEVMPPEATKEQMTTGCYSSMTDWDHKIGVLRAKLDLFE